MIIDRIAQNPLPDGEIYVVVEIPMNSGPVKYEIDKDSGAIFVDRFMQTTMSYPCNYGFIPSTLSDDGDPVDVLVISQHPVVPGSVIKSRPIGVLMMEDESGIDEKILSVPTSKLDTFFDDIQDINDVKKILKDRIVHFFEHYKFLEKGKWVKVQGWQGKEEAMNIIKDGFKRAKSK
jgi:inorganic pyrophosphatase